MRTRAANPTVSALALATVALCATAASAETATKTNKDGVTVTAEYTRVPFGVRVDRVVVDVPAVSGVRNVVTLTVEDPARGGQLHTYKGFDARVVFQPTYGGDRSLPTVRSVAGVVRAAFGEPAWSQVELTFPATRLPGERFAFTDVPLSHPFFHAIDWAASVGITRGTVMPDGTREFRPSDNVSREALAAFVYRAAGSPPITNLSQRYVDVPKSHPFYAPIEWLAQEDVFQGSLVGAGFYFKPSQAATRNEVIGWLYRSQKVAQYVAPEVSSFSDVATTDEIYEAVAWAFDHGITTGTVLPNGARAFQGADNVSREATAAFLFRVSNL